MLTSLTLWIRVDVQLSVRCHNVALCHPKSDAACLAAEQHRPSNCGCIVELLLRCMNTKYAYHLSFSLEGITRVYGHALMLQLWVQLRWLSLYAPLPTTTSCL